MKSAFIKILLLFAFPLSSLYSQELKVLRAIIVDNDTLPHIVLDNTIIIGFKEKTSKREQQRKTKLVKNILKVYPYARLAAEKLEEYDRLLALIPNKADQKKAMKLAEKEIKKEFTKDIENMTFSQGIVLLKLVDRETGKTTYKIVHELRGALRAFFYQTLARLFKFDLKGTYDPTGKDKEIEHIVRLIESGELY